MQNDEPQDYDLRLPKESDKMTRQERREWYRLNRKRLYLPPWSDLVSTLK